MIRRFYFSLLTVLIASFSGGALAQANTIVRFDTVMGIIDVELYDTIAPNYTANFLAYVNAGDYDNVLVHRASTMGSSGVEVIQGGRYRFDGSSQVEPNAYPEIPSRGFVDNEPSLSNVAGTLSLARPGGFPDAASREWFFNVTDNTVLDNPPGEEAFTVFGHVVAGMDVLVALHSLDKFAFQSPWGEAPMRDYSGDDYQNFVPVDGDNLVMIHSVRVIPEPSTLVLSGMGLAALLGLGFLRRRKK